MPRYYFNLCDGEPLHDPEGVLVDDPADVRRRAIDTARDLMAGEVLEGRLGLDQYIQVTDEAGQPVLRLDFRDAVQIESD